jgi:glucose-1-phosphate thymidylyltransferase
MLSPTTGIPKSMIKVGDKPKPILELAINNCKGVHGIDEFLIVVHKDDNMIQNYFRDGSDFGVNIRYVFQESPQGTADAIRCAEKYVDNAFLVIYGDNIFTKRLVESIKFTHEHGHKDAVATYGLYYMTDQEKLKQVGTAEIDDGHHILQIIEKSPTPISNYAVTGIMIFEPIIFETMKRNWHKSPRGEYEIHDYTNILLHEGRVVNAHISTDLWMDVTQPSDLPKANEIAKAIH